MTLEYKNPRGSILMSGDSSSPIRITAIEGLGLAEKEYTATVFSGYDGQETNSCRTLPRCITVGTEICSGEVSARDTLRILNYPGYLYIMDGELNRRIYCSQTKVSDLERVLKGQISTMAVQFVCDSPYFEDSADTSVQLYQRLKGLSTPFALPCVFGTTIMESRVDIPGDMQVEPVITIICPKGAENAETVTVENLTTGVKIQLNCTPAVGEEIVIDIKNRTVSGSICGNLLSNLSDDTFPGDFVLVPGENRISAVVGDIASGFALECRYNNLYCEAVIV